MTWAILAALLSAVCSTISTVLTLAVAWTRETATRSLVARTSHELSCDLFGPHGDDWLVDVAITVRNVGAVAQRYRRIRLRLRGLGDAAAVDGCGPAGTRLRLPVLATVELIPEAPPGEKQEYYYVPAGGTQRFSAITRIPAATAFVVAHAKLTAMPDEGTSYWPLARVERYDLDFTEERGFAVAQRALAPR